MVRFTVSLDDVTLTAGTDYLVHVSFPNWNGVIAGWLTDATVAAGATDPECAFYYGATTAPDLTTAQNACTLTGTRALDGDFRFFGI